MLKSVGLIGLVAMLAVSACGKKDSILPGAREALRGEDSSAGTEVRNDPRINRSLPFTAPPMRRNGSWVQSINSPATRNAHPALSYPLQRVWSVGIGEGNSRKARINTDPVVAGGRVFVMDAGGRVSAISMQGQVLWSTDLIPSNDSARDAAGGGLAYGEGKLYASTDFGQLTALDPATGRQYWQQDLMGTGGVPTYAGGLVYVTSGNDLGWALDAGNGRVRWQLSNAPDLNNVMGTPAPAVTGEYAVFGFGTSEIQTAFRKGGMRMWDAQIAGGREGYALGNVTDITGGPVVAGDRVYVANTSGRTVALNLADGERLWAVGEGASGQIWPSGGSLFMVSDRNELLRLSASDGARIWGVRLPHFTRSRPKRQSEIYVHYGPVVAGGQVVLASGDGQIRIFSPTSGKLTGAVELPGGATSDPVIAGGMLFVVSRDGQLHAYR